MPVLQIRLGSLIYSFLLVKFLFFHSTTVFFICQYSSSSSGSRDGIILTYRSLTPVEKIIFLISLSTWTLLYRIQGFASSMKNSPSQTNPSRSIIKHSNVRLTTHNLHLSQNQARNQAATTGHQPIRTKIAGFIAKGAAQR